MVKIRLKRLGSKKNPIYRVIVIDNREKREGRPIEELGFYNPRKKELKFEKIKALEWIKKGAQPTETVNYLIKNSDEQGTLIKKASVEEQKLSKKVKAKMEAEEKAKAEAAAKAKEEEKAKADAEAAKAEAEKAEPADEAAQSEPVAEEAAAETTEA